MARPTLVSLAAELGVSRQTVSNVINAPHLVKPTTRERVQAAIVASGYRPNTAAQALRNQRSRTLALRVNPPLDGINGAVMDRFVHELVQALRRHGYHLMLVTAADPIDEVNQLTELFVRGSVDGCVLTDTFADDPRPELLAKAKMPVAAFGRPWGREATATHIWVDIDGAAGTRDATQFLLDKGIHRIGFVGWPFGSESGDDRRRGWCEALEAAGIRPDADWTTADEDGTVQGLVAGERLFSAGMQALVCASDSLALGALEAARRHDLPAIDGQRPVIGFDDTPVARAVGLSSVSQPVEQCASLLATHFARALDHGDSNDPLPSLEHLLTPWLVGRVGGFDTTIP